MEKISLAMIVEKMRRNEINEAEAKVLLETMRSQPRKSPDLAQINSQFPHFDENKESSKPSPHPAEIAVIGMAGQFPDAGDVNTYWQNLLRGHDAVHELPDDYLNQNLHFSGMKQPGKTYCKWGGILEDRDCFDPLFFNISPREAESMNPHQRLILQESWKALEDAGYNPQKLADHQVGIFIGAEPSRYAFESFTGSSDAIIASRLSYFLNFKGPALVVNTGCSSSGVAIHLACESLRHEESSVALAGGVFANLDQHNLVSLAEIEMLSPSGRCFTFDEKADGTVLSEGVGVLLLKRLEGAIADGDHIYGVIKGSGVNQDGASNGITAPNGVAQEQLIAEVYRRYHINPEEITYLEAHGTGTKLGDPVEVNALVRAFRQFTQKEHFCAIGSAKPNIGHTAAAAGVIGLIKILLSIQHQKIPGLIHFKKINPLIELEKSPFYMNTETVAWNSHGQKPLMAALSSFGHSGTNVHLVVGEYIPSDEGSKPASGYIHNHQNKKRPVLIPLSAKSKDNLRDYAAKMLEFLNQTFGAGASSTVSTSDTAGPGPNRHLPGQAFREMKHDLERRIRTILSEILRVKEDEIDDAEKFSDYGVTQIQVWQVIQKLREEFDVEIQLQECAGINSIVEIAQHLTELFGAAGPQARIGLPGSFNLSAEKSNSSQPIDEKANQAAVLPAFSLTAMAYTLQTGREAMEERVIFLVHDEVELITKLKTFLADEAEINNCWQGQAKPHTQLTRLFASDEEMREGVQKWFTKGKLSKIAEVWVQGFIIDWELLYQGAQVRRIPLPTYPFSRKRYWAPQQYWLHKNDNPGEAGGVDAFLHPLLHKNTSDFWEQRFSSIFNGNEFFLADHRVKSQRVLPGVAYLEMARAAIEMAVGARTRQPYSFKLRNVVWIQPVFVGDQPVQLHIGLFSEPNGEIAYKIYSQPKTGEAAASLKEEAIAHSQGIAVPSEEAEPPVIDLQELLTRCSQNTLAPDECYQTYSAVGINYGPGHRGLQAVHMGTGCVLAKLSIPPSVAGSQSQFVLHPSILDSALQASIGLIPGGKLQRPSLPFSLDELEIFNSVNAQGSAPIWAIIRPEEVERQRTNGSGGIEKLHIDLCDERGMVWVRLKGLTTRVFAGELPEQNSQMTCVPAGNYARFSGVSSQHLSGTARLTPVWDVVRFERGPVFPAPTDGVVVIGGDEANQKSILSLYPNARVLEIKAQDTIDKLVKKVKQAGPIDHIIWISPSELTDPKVSSGGVVLNDRQMKQVLSFFRMIKALLQSGYGSEELGWSIITFQAHPIHHDDLVDPFAASLHGLVGSMSKEYSNWKVRLIDLEASAWPYQDIFTVTPDPQGEPWVYRGGEWYRLKLLPIQYGQVDPCAGTIYKTGGIYVVIGGAGGIGAAWSEYMIRTYQAQVVWIGRRPKDEAIQAQMDTMANLGPAPYYIACDASNLKALQNAYREIKERYPEINGIIHSALVLADRSLVNMEEEWFRAALSAKVDVSLRLAQVLAREPLDFVLFFSSFQSFIKTAGQSNYAAGCAFTDAFAHWLGRQWPCKVKVMNWGYWGSRGSVASQEFQDRMARAGIGSLDEPEAMEALEILLAGPADRIALIKTTKPLALEELNAPTCWEETITVYSQAQESFPILVRNLSTHIPASPNLVKDLKDDSNSGFDGLLCKLLLCQLQSLGFPCTDQGAQNLANFKTGLGLSEIYSWWLDESIAILAGDRPQTCPHAAMHKYLVCDGQSVIPVDKTPLQADLVWKDWDSKKERWLANSNLKPRVVLVEALLKALPDILTGKIPATEIVFPDSSMERVAGIYQNNGIADYFNEIIADTIATYIQEWIKAGSNHERAQTGLRLIEIGAGTGGSSAVIFRKLKLYLDHIREYCFTDISKAFLFNARETYGPENPYLTYKIFDVSKPFTGQEIEPGGYDIAIAANVLHATVNIRETLRNVKATLKKNGLLLLNEISGNSLFLHLTFGLLEGWWLSEDRALRIPGCPGLTPETWQGVLESEGFRSVSHPAAEALSLGQQIIVAESNGLVRRPLGLDVKPEPRMEWKAETPPVNKALARMRVTPIKATPEKGLADESLREKTTAYLKNLIGETIKLPDHEINSAAPLEKYGIDSILVVRLTNVLGKVFNKLTSTVFFEYQTIDALVEYFLQSRKEELLKLFESEDPRIADGIENFAESAGPAATLPETSGARVGETAFHVAQAPNSGRFWHLTGPVNSNSYSHCSHQPSGASDVAIIGISGRYPGANNLREFWVNLKEGRNCVTEIPKERWDWRQYFDNEKGKKGKMYTKWGGFIEDIDKFDPLFFQIPPVEAEQMDPQERLFLEVSYESIEDAGYTPATLCESKKVGVFVGVMNGNYPTGSQYWSIANRVSYHFNFQGPSLAVDTACSSSLTAIHLALESLSGGISECAIAGGVNLIIDPVQYLKLSAMTVLAQGNECKSFGDQGDGFVDGEGIGAIVLKPLPKAIAAGDHIYGIIKGSMLNAGGKTNGYTVPNPGAQFQLISDCLKRAGINARTISYVEAHGTGTALGDPIEIAGLKRAFEQDTFDKQYCAIGSLKSNIGHCESAAGIAALTKVLLQIKYGQLVPSLHSGVPNPDIDFGETPFTVQHTLAEWKRLQVELDGATKEYPRRAGISSFGAGGANAHLVIEEYIPEKEIKISPRQPLRKQHMIILSAKTGDRLLAQAQRLAEMIGEQQFSDNDLLDNIAFTLQVGRIAMEERLGIVAGSLDDLAEKLTGFLEGREEIPGLYRGQIKNQDTSPRAAVVHVDEELQDTVKKWNNQGKYSKILEFWVKGFIFDWTKLYEEMGPEDRPRRISLPTYPFAKEPYWITENHWLSKVQSKFSREIVAPRRDFLHSQEVHPLLHQNTSDLSEQRFSTTFTGQEFFLTDHLVKGRMVLPGVVYLEMARAAVTAATGSLVAGMLAENHSETPVYLHLKDVVWTRPMVVNDQPLQIHIGLIPEDITSVGGATSNGGDGEIEYEVYSTPGYVNQLVLSGENHMEPVVYSKGRAAWREAPESSVLDLPALQAQCDQNIITSRQCYDTFRSLGIDYGEANRGIETMYVGQNQILAELFLPPVVSETMDQYFLHPSMMDSALQAVIGFMIHESITGDSAGKSDHKWASAALPYALEELDIFSNTSSHMWAFVRKRNHLADNQVMPQSAKHNDNAPLSGRGDVSRFDIDLCDEQGKICARLKGFLTKAPESEAFVDENQITIGSLILQPYWKEQVIAVSSVAGQINPSIYERRLALFCEPAHFSKIAKSIEGKMDGVRCVVLKSGQKEIDHRFRDYAGQTFEEIRRFLKSKPDGPLLIQILVETQAEQQLFTGLLGLLKSASLENPKLIGQLVEVDAGVNPLRNDAPLEQQMITILKECGQHPEETRIRYQDGKLLVLRWNEVAVSMGETVPNPINLPWKDKGVYLISGGAGGLGLIIAKEIARQAKKPTLVLMGRSSLKDDHGIRADKITELEKMGAQVLYKQVDVADKEAVESLIHGIHKEFGRLHGIIHCAGLIRDNYILKKTGEELQEVLAPKVSGLVNLDQASKDLPLDFLIIFSSGVGSLGNPGQADYAAANAFMDGYARYRNTLMAKGERYGRTLVIDWPLWEEGGMSIARESRELLGQRLGVTAMPTQAGLWALYQSLKSDSDQVLVLHGDLKRLRATLVELKFQTETAPTPSATAENKIVPAIPENLLREKTINYLKKLLASTIKLPAEQIEAEAPLEKYGIDSLMAMQMTNQLEKTFGSLPKTLFFEYQNIRDLAGYFLQAYGGQLTDTLGLETGAEFPQTTHLAVFQDVWKLAPGNARRSGFGRRAFISREPGFRKKETPEEIAVIGLAGRYPQAENINKFWENLRDGKDCVTEIPKERWDHSRFFDADKQKPGKTNSKWGGFLEGVDRFDPLFFNISPHDAEIMDPQERLFLECVYETLEDAGYTRESLGLQNHGLGNNVGVYVGVMYEEYQLYGAKETIQGRPMALFGNPAAVANRVSYFCNFHGPSVALDTMCSSSLTTIHLACQSILHGGCEMAIAGGVNVSIHPNKYLLLGISKFASSKGRCESFGEGGDGYVPGEGVGAVLLKPLSKAIADGDHIYGIIKATAINHGGKTNGYSVPNPNAQAEVIGRAFREAGIDPRTVSFIEAHGTGTSLGDPIEIAGLSKAFQEHTQDKQFCAIGSAKSNIGHCEGAAGIAAVTKVLLQLKHRQLAPSLHSKTLNPNIDFANTPFFVQQKLEKWERPVVKVNGEMKEYPRRAGISSFGAGGSNAHVVVEEYIPKDTERPITLNTVSSIGRSHIMVLSAKNEERLRAQVQRFIDAIQERRFTDIELPDMAYTLQAGREALEERLAVIVNSLHELEEKLKCFMAGGNGNDVLYRGHVKRNKDVPALFTPDEDLVKTIDALVSNDKYDKLAELWVNGLVFDWSKLYGDRKPQRISLPTYPFAQERYWAPDVGAAGLSVRANGHSPLHPLQATVIHPLLHQNTSDFTEQRYSSTFTGGEFFLANHEVKGRKVLPGVASLEMARAAVEAATGKGLPGTQAAGIRFKNVVWTRPITVGDQAVRVHIGLYLEENGQIGYKIYTGEHEGSLHQGVSAERVAHSQGLVDLSPVTKLPILDLAFLQTLCVQKLSPVECYKTYQEMGIDYGPAFRGVSAIYAGQGQILAKLSLPSIICETLDQYILHPSLMDAALQASLGLVMGSEENASRKPFLPFALHELEIFGKCDASMWALIKYSNIPGGDFKSGEDRALKLDIDLCDDHGMIRVRMKGFSARVQEGEKEPLASLVITNESPAETETERMMMLVPVWDPVQPEKDQPFPTPAERIVIIGGDEKTWNAALSAYSKIYPLQVSPQDTIDEIVNKLETVGLIDHILWIAPQNNDVAGQGLVDETLIEKQEQGVLQVFKIIKALLRSGYGVRKLSWSIITFQAQPIRKNDAVDPSHSSLHGLTGSMAKEYPNWKIRLVDLETDDPISFSEIFTLPPDSQGNSLAYRGREWYRQKLIPFQPHSMEEKMFKPSGVYVVIGGAGGVGEAFSEYMTRVHQAQIVWIGRRQEDDTIRAKIEALAKLGPTPRYIAADATDRNALQQAYEEIKMHYSKINGVIHSAIVLADQSLANMEEESFRVALAAKVDVSVRIAQVFQNEPLDFMLFFSSMTAFTKTPGQSNYASGCAFKDAFAYQLGRNRSCPVKVINWGYWGSRGAVASKVYQERMARAGIGSIEPPEAIEAIKILFASPMNQLALLKTTVPLTHR